MTTGGKSWPEFTGYWSRITIPPGSKIRDREIRAAVAVEIPDRYEDRLCTRSIICRTQKTSWRHRVLQTNADTGGRSYEISLAVSV